MITLTINGKKHKAPICKEELTTNQYQLLITEWDGESISQLFSILTGTEHKEIKKTKDYKVENSVYAVCDFVYQPSFKFDDIELPKVIKIKEKVLMIPKRLDALSLEQAIHLRQRMEKVREGANNLGECISYACAVYLQPIYDGGEFDKEKALELEKVILEMSIVDTYPVGFFFLKKLNQSGQPLTRIWSQIKDLWMRCRKELQNRLKSEGYQGSMI